MTLRRLVAISFLYSLMLTSLSVVHNLNAICNFYMSQAIFRGNDGRTYGRIILGKFVGGLHQIMLCLISLLGAC